MTVTGLHTSWCNNNQSIMVHHIWNHLQWLSSQIIYPMSLFVVEACSHMTDKFGKCGGNGWYSVITNNVLRQPHTRTYITSVVLKIWNIIFLSHPLYSILTPHTLSFNVFDGSRRMIHVSGKEGVLSCCPCLNLLLLLPSFAVQSMEYDFEGLFSNIAEH